MIALILYILFVDYIYDAFAPLDSTNWAIFYFSNHYVGLGLILLKARKSNIKMWRPLYISVASGFFVKALLELTKIGMTIKEYNESVNSIWSHIIFSFVIITLIIISYYGKIRTGRS